MKKLLMVLVILAFAAPVFAQGPFNDVPTDHWAYEAINQLQQSGVLIGYPDGTFSGKRTITRYEFATALARVISLIPNVSELASKSDLSALEAKIPGGTGNLTIPGDLVKKGELSAYATKVELSKVAKLVDEFRDELAAVGVDVDAVKRDVAALDARLAIVEAEQKRVKITGSVSIFAFAAKNNYANTAFDLDNRQIPTGTSLLDEVGVVKQFDLNIVGRVNDCTTANATITYGNYLNYLGAVDAYAGGVRPTTAAAMPDTFFPYYLYIDTAIGQGAVTVGRFPIQFTPYTLKKIDVDSYTNVLTTDDGNYAVDGIKAAYALYGADLTLFAAKNDQNAYFVNGLTGQPNSGIPALNAVGGNAVGGLRAQITQSAGARAQFGVPFGGNMGITYYQAWSATAPGNYDQARVFGGDLSVLVADRFNVVGSYTKSEALAKATVNAADVADDNAAWDAKVATGFGRLGVAAGYKDIGINFAAAGAWDKIGRWTNPVNVKGPYADFSYPIMSNLKLALNGEMLTWKKTAMVNGWGAKDDTIIKGEAGLNWGLSKSNSVSASYEYVKWDKDAEGVASATETYLTLGLNHQMGANAGMKIGYQFINYDDGNNSAGPYAGDYRGGLGVVQFGVTF